MVLMKEAKAEQPISKLCRKYEIGKSTIKKTSI